MTSTAHTTAASFFEQAFERLAAFAREQQARRAQRIVLATLMDMDAGRLDDLGLNAQDVAEALSAPPPASQLLEDRRALRATSWTARDSNFAH